MNLSLNELKIVFSLRVGFAIRRKLVEVPIPEWRTGSAFPGDPGYDQPTMSTFNITPKQGGKWMNTPYQRITNHPSNLTDWDKADIADRIAKGQATGMDLLYASAFKDVDEIVRDRKGWSEARQILDIALRRQGLRMFNAPMALKNVGRILIMIMKYESTDLKLMHHPVLILREILRLELLDDYTEMFQAQLKDMDGNMPIM